MTTAETAEFLRVHVDTLRRWRLAGYGPAYLQIGRTYRYWRSDIMAWLNKNRPDAGPGRRGG